MGSGPSEGGGTEQWQCLEEGEPGPWQAPSLAHTPQKQGARDQETRNKARSSMAERHREECQRIKSGENVWIGPAPTGAEMDPRSPPPLHSSAVSKCL